MKTKPLTSEKKMLHAAFKEMRKRGVKASLGVNGCCRSCIWAENDEEWRGSPVVWFYKGQDNRLTYDFDDNVTSHSVIYLNHNSELFPEEIAECAKILADVGLNVRWDGTHGKCIGIVFE